MRCEPGRFIIAAALIGFGVGLIAGKLLSGCIIIFGILFAGFGIWLIFS